jgi:hypothetical protein
MMTKKELVSLLNTLANILDCLRANNLPGLIAFSELGDV